MARHQIIYTSCRRGRDGIGDGQQVYSYDESFSSRSSDEVRGLFSYQPPYLAPGQVMTEELVPAMPRAFMYRYLKSGACALTLNTYLGRDYMGASGRFGNVLSHSIICDFEDFDVYPCELYGSSVLRSSMDFKEVNSSAQPEYLSTPELSRGPLIDIEGILDFLGEDDRLDYYKKMLQALLQFPIDKRRILICDSVQNTMRWMAALHYAFPLDIAKKLSFTSYEFEPELSYSQICGVIPEGSRYHVDAYLASAHYYVFDFINNKFSDIKASGLFMDFIDTVFSFSYESLCDFHDFVMRRTSLREAGPAYSQAYYLYHILNEGLSYINQGEFLDFKVFVTEYAEDELNAAALHRLMEDGELIGSLDSAYALSVLSYFIGYMDLMTEAESSSLFPMLAKRLSLALASEEEAASFVSLIYAELSPEAKDGLHSALLEQGALDALHYLYESELAGN